MVPNWLKRFYYFSLKGPLWANARLYRSYRAPKTGLVKVHLGPGQRNYLPGWINLDANIISSKPDVWANISDGLPFPDNSVDIFYSHHVIEHLPDTGLHKHFVEMFRALKPGGVIRVGGPNGDMAMRKHLEGDADWFIDFPDKRRSAGGRFNNFIFCRNEHLSLLSMSWLTELCEDAGFFAPVQVIGANTTTMPGLVDGQVFGIEFEPTPEAPQTLLIEARKPG
jgi:predicted SAM-dependent methyltransferase